MSPSKSVSTKTNLVLDLGIFTAFLVVSNPRLTGNSIHEWLSLSFAAAIITHLLFHWDWIIKIGSEFIKKLFHQSRLNFLVDALFFIAMTGAIFSGILISKDILQLFGIQLVVSQSWKGIHSLTANLSLVTLGVHIALHWKWILANLERFIANPIRSLSNQQPAPQGLATQTIRINENK